VFSSAIVVSASAGGAGGLIFDDVDGDGDLDVLFTAYSANIVGLARNLGGGTFSPVEFIPHPGSGSWALGSSDVDGDGDGDILLGCWTSGDVWLLENLGGVFAAGQLIGDGVAGPSAVAGGDLNGDGNNDVLCASRSDNSVSWFAGNGSGGFSPRILISSTVLTAFDNVMADVDEDGDLDVIVAGNGGGVVLLFPNLGAGSFGPQETLTFGLSATRSVLVADLFLDGDLDVVATSYNNSTVVRFENTLFEQAPEIHSVQGVHSLDQGIVEITGLRLDGTSLLVDGLPAQVVSSTATQLLMRVDPQQPGKFHTLELTNAFGTSVWPDLLPRYPALKVPPTVALGQSVDLVLDNGDTGAYVLAFSGALYSTPAPFVAYGWYWGLELNGVWLFAAGSFPPAQTAVTIPLPAVQNPALLGVPFHFQAWTFQESKGVAGFSGVASIRMQ